MNDDSSGSRKRPSGEADLDASHGDELRDTALSPEKTPVQEEKGVENSSARKQLTLQGSAEVVPPPPPSYVSPRQRKRTKRQEGREKPEVLPTEKAGSGEECRWEQ